MPLVEIIVGAKTDATTLARGFDYVLQIGKTPIVVNDSRGFYTSRVFSTYVGEGLTLLAEGVAPALIDNAGRMAGMPVGPLALADEVSLELMARIRRQTAADLGSAYQRSAIDEVCERMVDSALGRLGKKAGKDAEKGKGSLRSALVLSLFAARWNEDHPLRRALKAMRADLGKTPDNVALKKDRTPSTYAFTMMGCVSYATSTVCPGRVGPCSGARTPRRSASGDDGVATPQAVLP